MDDPEFERLVAQMRVDDAKAAGRPLLHAPNDVDLANARWGANCGPGAFAAVLGCNVFSLRTLFPAFPQKAYTTVTTMVAALDASQRPHRRRQLPRQDGVVPSLELGLVQVQWTGPWTDSPGANPRWAYCFTHWIGVARGEVGKLWVYDINVDHTTRTGAPCLSVLTPGGGGWVRETDWKTLLVPELIASTDRATGWFARYQIEVPCR